MKPPFAYGLNLYRMETQNLNITYKMLLRKQNVKYRLYMVFFVFCARHSYFLMKSQSFVNSLFNTFIRSLSRQFFQHHYVSGTTLSTRKTKMKKVLVGPGSCIQ